MSNWKGKNGPLLIAEIGGNHEGDFDYAQRLTNLAIDSGADFIKYQIYTGDSLVNPIEGEVRNKHFKKFELTREQHIQLAEKCSKNNVGYMASVWDIDAFEWIDPYISVYKIGSGDLTAYPVIEQIAKKGKPIILSTGLSYEAEVLDAVKFIQSVNPIYTSREYLAILQCTSMYPIPPKDANLNVMHRFRELMDVAIGYSDHTEGAKALEIAYAMGAEILEFHFTDNREGKTFRDHKVSLTNQEVKDLAENLRTISALSGAYEKKPLQVEGDHLTTFRRALYPAQDITINTVINRSHLVSLRPNHGIDARDFHKLLGKKCLKDLKKHEKLDWSYFE